MVLVSIGFIFFNCTSEISTNNNNDSENDVTSGNFRIIKIERSHSDGSNTVETFSYNDNNQVVEYKKILDDKVIVETINTYNSDGNITKKLHTENNDTVETIYTYNELSLLVKEEWTGNEGNGITTYKYDEKGRMIWLEEINYTDQIIDDEYYSAEFHYDDKDRVIKKISVESHGLVSTYQYFYDDEDKLVKETQKNQAWEYEKIYTYDSNGNLIKEENYSSDSELYIVEYIYEDGLLVEQIYEYSITIEKISANTKFNEKYYYDENGNMIKKEFESITIFNSEVNSEINMTNTYKYDENNNLIEEFESGDRGFGYYEVNIKYYYEEY
jgi:YD repeat-containing protein